MSVDVKPRSVSVSEPQLYYSADSLSFARSLLSDLEDELGEKAKQLTREEGRGLVTEEDMRRAADYILGSAGGEVDDSGSEDA